MAKFEFVGIDKYQAMLGDLGKKSKGVVKRAVYVGAEEVADRIKQSLRATGHSDTGALLDSMSLDTMKDKNGYIYTKISWVGYDSKHTPNALKAAALESGVSGKAYPKTHFISRAVKAASASANERMSKQLDHDIEAINKKYGG